MTAKKKRSIKPVQKTSHAFNKLVQRMEQLEQEVMELRAAVAGQAVHAQAELLPMTPEDVAEAKQQDALQNEMGYGYVISTNLAGDISRLLSDRVAAMVAPPRPGQDVRYEELRLYTASKIVGDMSDRFSQIWLDSEPLAGQPWSQKPPQEARQMLLHYLRYQTASELANQAESFTDQAISEVFLHERPSLRFDRVNQAPAAIEEGRELGHKVIVGVFDQLAAEHPALGQQDADKECQSAVDQTKATVMKVLAKYRRFVGSEEKPKTHEELYARCYMGILTNTLDKAFALAGPSDQPLPEGVRPLRTAGAILSELRISQRPNPDNETPEQLDEHGLKNGEPVETPRAVQTRELLRVIDVVWDSIYDFELQFNVQEAYQRNAQKLFPEGPRELDERFKAVGWPAVKDSIKAMHSELFSEVHKQDGWLDPRRVPLDRAGWTLASAALH